MKFSKTLLVLALLPLCLPVRAAAESPTPKTTLVLDASGSMWGQIDGKAKISIAQDVVGDLIRSLPEEMELGLTVYGHRRKGDCNDIENLIEPASGQRDAIVTSVNAISPKGKTPLSAAVLQAAKALRHTEEKASVILISDGEETCDLDPCVVGKELEKSGVDFTVHVVGFDIADDKTRRQLQCLAAETGGTYHSANNAASLGEALNAVATPGPEPEPKKADLSAPRKADAGEIISVSWQGPGKEGDFVALVPQGAGSGDLLASADLREGNPVPLKVAPELGRHELVYVDYASGQVLARAPLDIVEATARLILPDVVKAGGSVQVEWSGPNNPGDHIGIARSGAPLPEYTFFFETAEAPDGHLRLPSEPGSYEVRYIANTDPRTILSARAVTVEDVNLSLKAPPTAKVGETISVLWNGTTNPKDYIAFSRPGEPLPHIVTMAETGEGNPLSVPVPEDPGTYELRYYFAEGDRVVRKLTVTVE
ncbi:vWA domain-containing protein [Roseibium aggregatum]|uniref:VWA domain-containing protein n=1 Tax=Roseibium aggregatum TaxID=187304 RepID=A0A939EIB5_9HYPH|nr:VWA domain-containing protein [Roseibium aggregatum]MBN9673549.1 VWA domain-containing protein [Roseibium aggregatum]